MTSRRTLRLATRGSALAVRQATDVKQTLSDHHIDVELVEVETTGDQVGDELISQLGMTGAFVRSLDEKVIAGEVDGAIHSMKDMPTNAPDELIVAGIPPRADPGDILVTPDGLALDALPAGACIGTASFRRSAQLRSSRPDLDVQPIRGNVDTRLEKLLAPSVQRDHESRMEAEEDDDDGESVQEWFDGLAEIERRALSRQMDVEYDGLVLAAAGLKRIGLFDQVNSVSLPLPQFVPAPGQGAIAVTAIDETESSELLNDGLDDPRTRVETTIERVILAELGGGCIAPIGIHAVIQGDQVQTRVQVFDREGTTSVEATRDLPVRTYMEAAKGFAADLRDRGADELIESARTPSDEQEPALRSQNG